MSEDFGMYCRLPAKDKSQQDDREMTLENKLDEPCSEWTHVCEEPIERILFLLDAYKPLIVGCVNVMDVILHIPFIGLSVHVYNNHSKL